MNSWIYNSEVWSVGDHSIMSLFSIVLSCRCARKSMEEFYWFRLHWGRYLHVDFALRTRLFLYILLFARKWKCLSTVHGGRKNIIYRHYYSENVREWSWEAWKVQYKSLIMSWLFFLTVFHFYFSVIAFQKPLERNWSVKRKLINEIAV